MEVEDVWVGGGADRVDVVSANGPDKSEHDTRF